MNVNILFVADVSIQKIIGGAERVLWEQTTRLAQRGHSVYVLTRKLPSHEHDYELINHVHEYRYTVDPSNGIQFLISSIHNAQCVFEVLTQKINFDVINIHQPFTGFAVSLLKDSHQIPMIYTCHSLSFEEFEIRNPSQSLFKKCTIRLQTFIRKFIERYALKHSHSIIVLSEFSKNKVTQTHCIPSQKIQIIAGAADTHFFQPIAQKQQLRKDLNFVEGQWILFTVRNLNERMGLDRLIDAMAIVCSKQPNIRLIIGGEGPLKEKLAQQIRQHKLENNITLCGFLSKHELLKFYQLAHFFILPSIALEGFGLVTVEAMACATPVLGTPIGGTKEILSRFNDVLLFSKPTTESMAQKILEQYDLYSENPSAYTKLCMQCREFIENYYSWNQNIQNTERVFQQCVASVEK